MGEVFAATDVQSGAPAVVKLLRASLTGNMTERFRLEAQVLAKLTHDNVVKVIDSGTTGDGARPYLVMERLSGLPLETVLKERNTLPAPEACDIARQVLAGLGYVHERGIVHRDIKPDNLFVCSDGTVKLLDFGVIKLVEALTGVMQIAPTQAGLAVGTPRYLSPEQAIGDPVDARTDVYAVGCVLYRMLAGRGPFDQHKSVVQMLMAHVHEAPEPPSKHVSTPLDARVDAIVLQALEKPPARRHQSAGEMAAQLAELAQPHAAARVGASQPLPDNAPTQALPAMPMMSAPSAADGSDVPAAMPPRTPETVAMAEVAAPMALSHDGSALPRVAVTQSGALGASLEAHALDTRAVPPAPLPRGVLAAALIASALVTIVIDLLARGL
jgi:serine/threonine-protein kinase